MKDLLHKIVLLTLCAAFLTVVAVGQTAPAASKGAMPFINGETLTYEGKISRVIKGIAVADLVFTITEPTTGEYLIKAEARSKGTLLKLFRYSFFQQVESMIPDRTFRIGKTIKHDTQKDRVRDSEAVFDYKDERVTYTETNPKEPMRPPRKIASEIGPETYDLVSGLYRLRMLPLALGKTFELDVSDSGLVYKIPVHVTGRERQKSIFGNVYCYRLEPDIFGPERLIEREGSMIIWITDDERRLPIRSQVNSPIGRIEIKLKSAKNLRS
jgi:uncharacterized protein DUF3108